MTPPSHIPGTLRMDGQAYSDKVSLRVRVGARNPPTDLGSTGPDMGGSTTDGRPNRIETASQPIEEKMENRMDESSTKPQSDPEAVNFVLPLPNGCFIDNLKLRQSADCCSRDDDDQTLELEFRDGGGGGYCVIRSDCWAVDADDLSRLSGLVRAVTDRNDSLSKKEAEKI